MTLRIADGFEMPVEYVTKTAAILAQRRKGKTYTASVIAEELVAAQLPFVVLDPTGAWWGLRAAANAVDGGLPVTILGGQHGDLPLERGAGRFIADLVLDHPGFYVLDLSLLDSRTAEREFAEAFAERLYRRKMQPGMSFPLHLFVDEADMFVPQEKESNENRMLGAFQAIVRRGGLHGLGTTLISQRPALVNKSVLTQLDILILLRLVAGNDQDYMDTNYIKRAASTEERKTLMESMAVLAIGEAWVWEPGAEPRLLERVRIRERRTFNSSATPKVGETPVEPSRLADVDLAEIKEAMSETIERAKADDPKELRRRIGELERQLRDRPAVAPEVQVRVERVEVIPGELIAVVNQARRSLLEFAEQAGPLAAGMDEAVQRAVSANENAERVTAETGPAHMEFAARPSRLPAQRQSGPRPVARPLAEGETVSRPQQRVLDAVAWLHDLGFPQPSKQQVGFIAGYRVGKKVGGTFGNILGQLRTLGLIDYPSPGAAAATSILFLDHGRP